MKKGFTLIELLAVIVVLAIIALIAVPVVLNIINDAKESSLLRSAEFYLSAVDYTIANAFLYHGGLSNGKYPITTEGDICKKELPCDDANTLKVEVNGDKPTGGYIKIDGGTISDVSLVLSDRIIVKNTKGKLVYSDDAITLTSAIFRDNIAQSDENIDFRYTSEGCYYNGNHYETVCDESKLNNGKGLYYTSKNTKDNKKTYYFRGAVENNYVEFGTTKTCTFKGRDIVYLSSLEGVEDLERLTAIKAQEQCTSTNVCDVSWIVEGIIPDEEIPAFVGLDENECNNLTSFLLKNLYGEELFPRSTCKYNGEYVVHLDAVNMKVTNVITPEQCVSTNICDVSGIELGNDLGFKYAVGVDDATCTAGGGTPIEEKAEYFNRTDYSSKASYNPNDSMLWRIVRINEDGSIRLITEDIVGESKFNEADTDNAYVGYMYGTPGSDTYEATHSNINNSAIKTYLDDWYVNTSNLINYSSYLNDTGFCNDRSVASAAGLWSSSDTALGYGKNYTIYGPWLRVNNTQNIQPQFKCPNEEKDLFTTNTSVEGNKSLTYPVGLLTVDEISYAGGMKTADNSNMYLSNGKYFWTMSPALFYVDINSGYSEGADGWYLRSSSIVEYENDLNYQDISASYGVRPVINLRSNIEITNGNGSKENPYVIKTN